MWPWGVSSVGHWMLINYYIWYRPASPKKVQRYFHSRRWTALITLTAPSKAQAALALWHSAWRMALPFVVSYKSQRWKMPLLLLPNRKPKFSRETCFRYPHYNVSISHIYHNVSCILRLYHTLNGHLTHTLLFSRNFRLRGRTLTYFSVKNIPLPPKYNSLAFHQHSWPTNLWT